MGGRKMFERIGKFETLSLEELFVRINETNTFNVGNR